MTLVCSNLNDLERICRRYNLKRNFLLKCVFGIATNENIQFDQTKYYRKDDFDEMVCLVKSELKKSHIESIPLALISIKLNFPLFFVKTIAESEISIENLSDELYVLSSKLFDSRNSLKKIVSLIKNF
jgi:hypothetical protein